MIETGMTTKQHFLTLEKAIALDFKNWYDPFNKYLYQQYVIIAEIISGKYQEKGFTWDTNRSLSQNMEYFKMWNNRAQNERIAEWQKNFSSIEGTTFDFAGTTVKVIVPVDVAQLIDEGQQQNNCVGHYYNSGIANHRQVICFVRKAETPNHSFVTCRYDVSEKTFVEMRFKNNYDLKMATNTVDEYYQAVKIPENSVVYCDPPYNNCSATVDKRSYCKGFDFSRFFDWLRKVDFPVFVSEYVMPEDFVAVWQKTKICTFSSRNNAKYTVERVFVHERFVDDVRRKISGQPELFEKNGEAVAI